MSSLRRVKVPEATSLSVSVFHSWSEPVTHEMRSGVVRAATSSTQAASRVCLVEPSLWICTRAVIVIGSVIPFARRLWGPPQVGICTKSCDLLVTCVELFSCVDPSLVRRLTVAIAPKEGGKQLADGQVARPRQN